MNIFSRVRSSVLRLLGKQAEEVKAPEPPKPGPHKRPAHMVRVRYSERPIFGPAFPDAGDEGHHISRQTCRAALRVRFFASVSHNAHPLMTRRERRRAASLFARLEYRRMMRDETNAIPDEAEQTFKSMTQDELACA